MPQNEKEMEEGKLGNWLKTEPGRRGKKLGVQKEIIRGKRVKKHSFLVA